MFEQRAETDTRQVLAPGESPAARNGVDACDWKSANATTRFFARDYGYADPATANASKLLTKRFFL